MVLIQAIKFTYNPQGNTQHDSFRFVSANMSAKPHIAPYNPITHQGDAGIRESARKQGVKLASAAATAGHLNGAACIPLHGGGASPQKEKVQEVRHITAKLDHLHGVACVPRLGVSEATKPALDSTAAASSEGPVNLRASVDHLAGKLRVSPACVIARSWSEVSYVAYPCSTVLTGGACVVRDVVAQVRLCDTACLMLTQSTANQLTMSGDDGMP